jgi:hypothetical protein
MAFSLFDNAHKSRILESLMAMNGLDVPINFVALYASEQKTSSYLAIL